MDVMGTVSQTPTTNVYTVPYTNKNGYINMCTTELGTIRTNKNI